MFIRRLLSSAAPVALDADAARSAHLCFADDDGGAGGGGGGDSGAADPNDGGALLGAEAAAAGDQNQDKPDAEAGAEGGDGEKPGEEAKAEGDKPDAKDGEGEDKDESDAPGDDALDIAKLKAPEGSDALDPKDIEEFLPVAEALGIKTNAQAQQLVDLAGKIIARRFEAVQAANIETLRGIYDGWKTDAAKDAEIGGADHQKKVGVAMRGLVKYGTPALLAFLDESKLGSHPEFVRLAYRVGLTVKEDAKLERGGKTGATEKSINERWGWKESYAVGQGAQS